MSKATIHQQTPYGVFVLFSSSQNQLKKKEHFSAAMSACHTIQCSHCRLSKTVDGGMKLLKGTESIIFSPKSPLLKFTDAVLWFCSGIRVGFARGIIRRMSPKPLLKGSWSYCGGKALKICLLSSSSC